MSLIAHYRLNGNPNESMSRFTGSTSGSVSWIDGKIGQAFSTGASNGFVVTNIPDKKFASDFSASAWVKIKQWGLSHAVFGTRNSPNGWMLYRNSGDVNGLLRFYMHLTDTTDTNRTNAITYNNFPLNEWFHVAVVRGNGWYQLWLNGELVAERTSISNFKRWNSDSPTPMRIGAGGSSWATSEMDIDDVRIFDHILSKREIRDLAQAKVLHYGFDNFAESTENVVLNTDLNTGWSKGYTQNIQWNDIDPPPGVNSQVVSFENDDTGGSGYWYSYGDYAPQADGTEYQVSLWVKTNQETDVGLEFYTADNSETDRYSSERLYVNASEGWKRLEWAPFTTADPTDSDSLSFRYFNLYEGGYTRLWLCAPQMEAKAYTTPFVDGIRVDKITDKSSQDNHTEIPATNPKTPRWVKDSKIGSGCYELDGSGEVTGTSYGSDIPVEESITDTRKYPDGCTYSFWLYVDTDAVDRMSVLRGSGTIRHIEIYSEGKYFRTEAAMQNGYSFGSSTFPDDVRGQWAHFVIVFANGETNRPVRWYQNGQLFHTGSMDDGANPGSEYFSFNHIGYPTGNQTYTYAKSFDGKVDDFRIYATALTQPEIEEVYQQRASLDNKGSFHTQGLNQISPSDHGNSEWVAMENGTVRYSKPYGNTRIMDNLGNIVAAETDPLSGTFSIVQGRTYYGSKPIHLMDEGDQHRIVPISLMGTQFGGYSVRYNASIYYIHAPLDDCEVKVFDPASSGVDGTVATTISVGKGSVATYTTATENAWVMFESDNPIVMSVTETSGGDKMIMPPASKYIYGRHTQYKTTVKGNPPTDFSGNHLYDEDRCLNVNVADGSGGDSVMNLGIENLYRVCSFGNSLSDYSIVAPYPDTEVDVLYWDGTNWVLGEHHSLNGSLLAPDSVFRDGSVGFGSPGTEDSGAAAYFASGANPWKFVSTQPIVVTINDVANDEEILLGWDHDGH